MRISGIVVYSSERSPNFSCKVVNSHPRHCTLRKAYLVAWHTPSSLGNELFRLLIDIRTSGCDFVLRSKVMSAWCLTNLRPTKQALHTTVSSSNGLASSIFLKVFSKSFNSKSTLPFVSSALFTACASNASMALICLPTS